MTPPLVCGDSCVLFVCTLSMTGKSTLYKRRGHFILSIYDSKKQDFEDVSDIFIRGIDSIIEVLKLVEELIDRYKDTRISADIDNT